MAALAEHPEPGDLDDLTDRFVACLIPKREWTHQAHLLVGLWHVHRFGADEAMARLRTGIRRLNEHHGTPNSATEGYHETITRAYVLLLSEFLAAEPAKIPLSGSAGRLLASPLAERDALLRFYSRERLMSPEARAQWVEPDIMALRCGGGQTGGRADGQ